MSTVTRERHSLELGIDYWASVVAAGLLAGVLMGLIMHGVTGTIQAVGSLYGTASTGYGWTFHLWHSVVFAALYGSFFMWRRLEQFHGKVLASTTLGVLWGVVLWFGAAGVVMPLWLGAAGPPGPSVPTLEPWSGLGHVLYGAVLGSTSAGLHRLQGTR